MKWYLLELLGVLPATVLILLTRDISGWSGFAIGFALVAYARYFRWIADKQEAEKNEAEYQLWVKERDARSTNHKHDF